MNMFTISVFAVVTFVACAMFALASPQDDKALYMKYIIEHGKQVDEATYAKK